MTAAAGRFEPKLIGLLCNWCAYEGADSAGRARKPYPANLRVVRMMCAGRVDPQFILKAFSAGADGVLILGCHPGECHYKEGNLQTLKRVALLKEVLPPLGIEAERLKLDWISASEGEKFVTLVTDMVEKIKQLGPLQGACAGGVQGEHV